MKSSSGQIRLIVIGAGAMGVNHARAINSHENCKLVGIIDTDLTRRLDAAELYSTSAYGSLEEALENESIDGAVVATSTASHLAVCNELIDHRIPFLVEKPVTDNYELTRELLMQSQRYSVPMMCGFVERFNPAVMTALTMLHEPVRHFLSVRHSPENPRATASVVHDLLIHDIDLAVLFNSGGSEILRIGSSSWRPADKSTDEICDTVIQFKEGGIATLSASRIGQRKIRQIHLTTDSHAFDIDLLRANLTVYRHVMQESLLDTGSVNFRAQTIVDIPFVRHKGEPLAQQIEHFRNLILGAVDPDEERRKIYAPHEVAEKIMRN